mmetsp:Transcript_120719/g.346860  ORF Transcript_120719/g.346860 Transcript_120719/m.346860 type:complete len:248 (+) Transcript_120719:1264-2007(+)
MSASSRAGPRIRAPQDKMMALFGTAPISHRYLSGVSNCIRSCGPRSICRSCSTASFCSATAVCNAMMPSTGRSSGNSSRVRNMLERFSGVGSFRKAMASSCDARSSRMRRRFLESSATAGRRCAGVEEAAAFWPADEDPGTARVCERVKCLSSASASNGAGADDSSKRLPLGTCPTAVQNTCRIFGPADAFAEEARRGGVKPRPALGGGGGPCGLAAPLPIPLAAGGGGGPAPLMVPLPVPLAGGGC